MEKALVASRSEVIAIAAETALKLVENGIGFVTEKWKNYKRL